MRLATLTLLSSVLLAPAAHAQIAGQRLWALDVWTVPVGGLAYMSQPRVAPDGTVYLVTDSLYAVSPAGQRLWTAPARDSEVDLGPDGTVYTASDDVVFAYNPDGTERWRFENVGGFGVTTGPTVGPDGNVYAVTVNGGLGVFSLTPGGALRWNVPGFFTSDGAELDRVAFGPDNLYYADGTLNVAGCPSPYDGLVSISLGGDLEWCRSISGVFDPPVGVRATRDGRAIVRQNALPDAYVQAYTPGGALDWFQTFLPSDLSVGADNNVYAWHDGAALVSLTADGAQRWRVEQPLANSPWRPEVAPDTGAVVAGSNYGFGTNGRIVAADPADGRTLWSLDVTGPSAGVGGPAGFSPDGEVVYVPVNTVSFDEPDQLWAIQVRNGRPSGAEPDVPGGALALSAPAPNPASSSARLTVTLSDPEPVTVGVYDALGRRVAVLHDGPLAAGAHALTLDASALPAGVYVVRASVDGAVAVRRVAVAR